jgi:general stress protein YciG
MSWSRGRQDDDDERYGRWGSHRGYRDDDEYGRRSGRGRQGFASMDPRERSEIGRMGAEARWGRSYRDDDDDDRSRFRGARGSRDMDDDDERSGRGYSRRGFASWDPEERREVGRMGAEARWGRSYRDDDDDDRSRSRSTRSSRYEDDDDDYGRRSTSRRGFASWDPEELREVARLGGLHSHGGQGRTSEEEDRYSRSRRSRRYEDDEDDRESRGRGTSRRGFASMDPEEHRRISRMGGQASHGGR